MKRKNGQPKYVDENEQEVYFDEFLGAGCLASVVTIGFAFIFGALFSSVLLTLGASIFVFCAVFLWLFSVAIEAAK